MKIAPKTAPILALGAAWARFLDMATKQWQPNNGSSTKCLVHAVSGCPSGGKSFFMLSEVLRMRERTAQGASRLLPVYIDARNPASGSLDSALLQAGRDALSRARQVQCKFFSGGTRDDAVGALLGSEFRGTGFQPVVIYDNVQKGFEVPGHVMDMPGSAGAFVCMSSVLTSGLFPGYGRIPCSLPHDLADMKVLLAPRFPQAPFARLAMCMVGTSVGAVCTEQVFSPALGAHPSWMALSGDEVAFFLQCVDACLEANRPWVDCVVRTDAHGAARMVAHEPWEVHMQGVGVSAVTASCAGDDPGAMLRTLCDAGLLALSFGQKTHMHGSVYVARPYMMLKRACGRHLWDQGLLPAIQALALELRCS